MESKLLNTDLIYQVLSVVNEIPYGKVASYGQIAKLVGHPKHARLIGNILSHADYYGDYPCHRVVNHVGRIVPTWLKQKEYLLAEGIAFKNEFCVDMKKYQWNL
ncbi:MAG: methylated-DNA--[protein]-cysteine S-methyltransferase [Anaeroplasmataceae bacterium]|nr:methylated-DNA--[protein]-cysteine S-methyltransferase [Anaeroplasmataceae bacterium]